MSPPPHGLLDDDHPGLVAPPHWPIPTVMSSPPRLSPPSLSARQEKRGGRFGHLEVAPGTPRRGWGRGVGWGQAPIAGAGVTHGVTMSKVRCHPWWWPPSLGQMLPIGMGACPHLQGQVPTMVVVTIPGAIATHGDGHLSPPPRPGATNRDRHPLWVQTSPMVSPSPTSGVTHGGGHHPLCRCHPWGQTSVPISKVRCHPWWWPPIPGVELGIADVTATAGPIVTTWSPGPQVPPTSPHGLQ